VRFAACHSAANTSHAGRADKVCRQLGRVHQLPTRSQNLFALTIGTRNVRGEGSLRGLFERVIFPLGMASPRGTVLDYTRDFQGIWRSDRRVA
jgi:hypothetical protein